MQTFIQKQKATQQIKSIGSQTKDRTSSVQNSAVDSIVYLQRTIGNQAVLRLLKGNTEEYETASNFAVPNNFSNNFNRIPLHAKLHAEIQPKLTVNTPGDLYEQEADRVADQVTRMPDQQIQRTCACGGSCASCQEENNSHSHLQIDTGQSEDIGKAEAHTNLLENVYEHGTDQVMRQITPEGTEEEPDIEKQHSILKLVCPDCEDLVQAKEASSEGVKASPKLESQIKNVQSGGQPLADSVRESLEPKFGHDFSDVRIHTDTRAGDTAREINALAYTVGPHIIFAPGQFTPHSYPGKKLLVHELTHVVQQSSANKLTTNPEKNQSTMLSTGTQIGIQMQADSGNIFRHTAEDCDQWYEQCGDGCRNLPNRTKRDKARRALCWARCATEYGACLASSEEALAGALTATAIAAAIALAMADGPFPIGDAAAVGLLSLVGIRL